MSIALYNEVGGLRFWRQNEIRLRNRIKETLSEAVQTALLDMNQMWRFEEVDTPVIMPTAKLSCQDHIDDVFLLKGQIAGQPHCLRAETTPGSYAIAEHLLVATGMKAPFCVWTAGQSFRQEKSDGATAAKLRFNAFYQLEFQCIYTKPFIDDNGKPQGTHAPIPETLRTVLREVVAQITGLETRLVASDRLPAYAEETIDIEVNWRSPTTDEKEWKEVCSTSIRKDFPEIPGQKPYRVFEVAFGLDRMVAVTQGNI